MVRDIDDLHGVAAAVDLRPGSQVGTTDLDLALKQVKDFQQSVSVNNYGSKLTGEWLFNGNFQYGNLLGLGERYVLNVTGSNDSLLHHPGRHPDADRAAQRHPRHAAISSATATSATPLPHWGRTGTTNDFKIGLSSALLNTAKQKITVRVGFDARHLVSTIINGSTIQSSDDDSRILPRRHLSAAAAGHDGAHRSCSSSRAANAWAPATRAARWPACSTAIPRRPSSAAPFSGARICGPTVRDQGTADRPICQRHAARLGSLLHRRLWQRARLPAGAEHRQQRHADLHRARPGRVWQKGCGVSPSDPGSTAAGSGTALPGAALDSSLYSLGCGAELHTGVTTIGDTSVRFDWAHPVGTYKDTERRLRHLLCPAVADLLATA